VEAVCPQFLQAASRAFPLSSYNTPQSTTNPEIQGFKLAATASLREVLQPAPQNWIKPFGNKTFRITAGNSGVNPLI